ncbi:hypothetical protein [Amycolatopsis sp. H20-H5]|uniref:hypothetical protein n=1 Tax=Amycolatopsis sp. H20-H5 TaxID=3046309 RepID=UPI002DB71379|nr:hypothetical protein [Amycolatopsis sp. H20-H5]MEC3976387.1 hypothetical protein [Amycolatopsis sp. H20-H5]
MTTTLAPAKTRPALLRKIGGYGAAISVTPYLVIKIAWTFGLFLPTEQMGQANWRAINATTALLTLVGIMLALAFSRPWGERLPAWLVTLPVWVGTGLLVPMLFLVPILGPAAVVRDKQAGASTDTWAYEQVFVIVSLVGIGIGLPLALAGYARVRWPEALSGPLDRGTPPGDTRELQVPLASLTAVGCVLLGVTKVFWTLGGTIGLDPSRLGSRDLWWRLLSLSTGLWALAGAWGLLTLVARRGSRRFLPPMALAWVSSGMLFAYNLFFAMRADSQASPEHPLARVLTTDAGIVLGVLMAMLILLVLHDRRRATHAE